MLKLALPMVALAMLVSISLAGAAPLTLKEQGSFFVGGEKKTVSQPGVGPLPAATGEITVNQIYVQYQLPAGRSALMHLPTLGIKGDSHMLMQDRNSDRLADLVIAWIDKRVEDGKSSRR
jgi:hypothetical protein